MIDLSLDIFALFSQMLLISLFKHGKYGRLHPSCPDWVRYAIIRITRLLILSILLKYRSISLENLIYRYDITGYILEKSKYFCQKYFKQAIDTKAQELSNTSVDAIWKSIINPDTRLVFSKWRSFTNQRLWKTLFSTTKTSHPTFKHSSKDDFINQAAPTVSGRVKKKKKSLSD